MQRGSFSFRPLGRDVMNPGRVHRDGEVRWINDETVLALSGVIVYDQIGRVARGIFSFGLVTEYFGRPRVSVLRERNILFTL